MYRTRYSNRNWMVATLLCFVPLGMVAGASEVMMLTEEDLPKLLASRNQAVRGAVLQAESSELRTGHLVRSYIPSVHLELGGEHFQTGPYPSTTQPYGSLETRLNLFRGGKDLLEDRIRTAQSQAASAQGVRTRALALAEARKTYWTLVYQRDQIRVLKSALEENTRNIGAANRRIQRGVTTDTDRLDFQIFESQLKEDIESMTHQSKQTQILLRSILALHEEVEIQTREGITHSHDEAILENAVQAETQYDVSYLKATQLAAQSEQGQLSRWWMPSIDAYAGYYLFTLRDRDYQNRSLLDDKAVGIRLTLNLFDGFQSTQDARAASMRTEALENQVAQLERDTRARLRVAQEDMKHEHELTHESEKRIEQGKAYLAKTLSEYDRGVKNAPDVLSASQRLLGFQRRLSEILKNYQFAKAETLAILGK